MNNIQTTFSIKDLENLSGIMAHTIRIWEKRYNILEPKRTETNIRFYDVQDLQRLLNVTLLYNNGFKISRIAHMSRDQVLDKVKEHLSSTKDFSTYSTALRMSMINFDQGLFDQIYDQMCKELNFTQIFEHIYIPLLNNIGLDWQSDNITPAHEHFISNLIMQKLHSNIESIQREKVRNEKPVFVLYLPINEIHEIGLLFIHYQLMARGYKSIYLGASVPMDNLISVQSQFKHVQFVSYFTIKPAECDVSTYLEEMRNKVLLNGNSLNLFGRRTNVLRDEKLESIRVYSDSPAFFEALDLKN